MWSKLIHHFWNDCHKGAVTSNTQTAVSVINNSYLYGLLWCVLSISPSSLSIYGCILIARHQHCLICPFYQDSIINVHVYWSCTLVTQTQHMYRHCRWNFTHVFNHGICVTHTCTMYCLFISNTTLYTSHVIRCTHNLYILISLIRLNFCANKSLCSFTTNQ